MKVYFPLGGGPCSGISKPGVMTWARSYETFGEIGMDGGIGEVMELPQHEVNDRLKKTPSKVPLANIHVPGDDRDQLMATHRSNHITIGDGNILPELVATCLLLGIPTRVADNIEDTFKWSPTGIARGLLRRQIKMFLPSIWSVV